MKRRRQSDSWLMLELWPMEAEDRDAYAQTLWEILTLPETEPTTGWRDW